MKHIKQNKNKQQNAKAKITYKTNTIRKRQTVNNNK